MKEEDDMLELLDEEDLGADSADSDELELSDDSDDESMEESLSLDEPEEEAGESEEPELELSEEPEEEPGEESEDLQGEDEISEDEEPEGLVLDIRYIAVAAVAIIAILIGVVFIALPMLADNPPVVSFTSSQEGEDLYLTHTGTDPLTREALIVQINGAPVPADKYMLMGGASWPWAMNSVLKVDTSGYTKPAAVSLIYKPKSTEHFIFGATAQPTPTPTPTPTPEPVITPDQMGQNGTVPSNMTPGGAAAPQTGGTEMPVQQPVVSDTIVMMVSPASGSAPLTVECSDQTAGCIRNRVWNFGDGQTSMKRSPTHVFAYPGEYNVTLDVRFCDPDDNPTTLPVQQVVVAPSERHDTLAGGTGIASVLPGAKFFFTVKGPGTTVRIGGRDHILKSGDHVQLTLGSGGSGDISIVSKAILRCAYDNVTMSVNGDEGETGTISVINIDQYLEFETADLTIQVLAGRDGAKGMVDAEPVLSAAPGQMITLSNVGADSSGKLLFSSQNSAGFSFRGGIGSYEVITPAPV